MVGSVAGVGGGGGGGGGGGTSGGERSKEAVGMMALHEALRTVCLNSDWTYSVFWTIRPRPRIRGGNGCKVGDDNGSLMLMWEDGFCRGRVGEQCLEEIDSEDPIRKAFSKMSIQLYNYGEGLMGKVASDKCHKWVFKEPSEAEPNVANYWQSSFDALPTEWNEQFESGIQTIAVIQAGHGLLQLGSCKIIPEDLHFVLRMRHTFESLGYQSGFYLSQLFSANRNGGSSSSSSMMQTTTKQMQHQQQIPQFRPPPLFWGQQRPAALHHAMLTSPTSYHQHRPHHHQHNPMGNSFPKDETTMFLMPHSASEPRMDEMTVGGDHHHNHNHHQEQADLKWPNGLSFFNALTGRADDGRSLLFNPDSLGNKPLATGGGGNLSDGGGGGNNLHTASTTGSAGNPNNEFLSLDHNSHHHDHQEGLRKSNMESGKFKRSFTLPARMASSSSSTSIDQLHQQHHQQSDFRNPETGMYPDVMDTFLE